MFNNLSKNKAIVLFFLILLLYLGALNNYLGIIGDDALFIVLGKSLTQGQYTLLSEPGEPFHTKVPPLFPLLLSPVIYFFGYNIFLLKLVSCLSLIAALYFLYKILLILNRELSLLVLCLSAFCPLVFMFSHQVMSESLYMLLSFLALYFIGKNSQEKKALSTNWVFGAIFCAAAFLTRVIGISLFMAVVLLGLVKFFFGGNKKLIVKKTVVFFVLFFCLVAFWVIKIYNVDETPAYIQEFLEGDVEKNELIKGQSVFPNTESNMIFRLFDNLYYYSGPIIALDLGKVVSLQYEQFLPFVFPLGLLLWLLIIGTALYNLFKRHSIIDAYVLIYLGIVFLWYWRSLRFLTPIIPFLILYLLQSAQGILRALSKKRFKGVFNFVVVVLLLMNFIVFSYEFMRQHKKNFYNTEWNSYYKASVWLKNAEDGVVMARKWANTFIWSGKKCVMVPQTSDRTYVERFIEENRVRYVLLDGFERYKTEEFLGFVSHSENFKLIHKEKLAKIFQKID